ncbi:T9SS type A sorting domain-containing protein [Flavobacterium sp.]|uniref:DUF7619 domain-containing protein n=1 Tax=Flavobacterium sp. TaxID=239 RepID=UPI002610D016|nr:T9SS type A sorting domain-containing protein [Flavobacterium sp.]
MRTLLIILLFVSGFAFAQPSINNPTSLQVCDDGNDGFENFNLFSKNAEVLGSLNASNHTVSYHETLVDAENNLNALPSVYSNIVNNQIIYVRVIENSSPTLYSTTTLTLEAVSYPLIIPMSNVTVCESYTLPALPFGQNYYTQTFGTGTLLAAGSQITTTQTIYIFAQTLTIPPCTSESSFTVTVNSIPTYSTPPNLVQNSTTGTAVFDLATQNSLITTDADYSIFYFETLLDTENTINAINPLLYENISNPQTIYARVQDNATGCYSITNFNLIVNTNPFPINNPTPLYACDSGYNSGFGLFYLVDVGEILGSLNPSLYSVTYHETLANSQTGANPLSTLGYANIYPFFQTIYVRVTENANPTNFATTTLDLIVNPSPILNSVPNLTQVDNDGYASFDLTTHNSLLIAPASITDYGFLYYPTITDAANGTNQILDFFNYTNSTNPQNIIVKVTNNVTGCYQFSGFDLVVQASDFPINTPTTLSTCGNASGFSNFNLHSKDTEILGSLNPSNYTVTYYANSNDAFNEQNALASPFTNTTASYQTIFVRVDENSTASFSTTTLQLYSVPPPFIATTVPNLTVTENPFDGVATFNLTTQNNYITTIPTQIINFFTTQTDAENQTNAISNPSSFTGNHLQTIWFSLTEPSTGCFTIESFTLNVFDSSIVVYIPDNNFKTKLLSANPSNTVAKNLAGNYSIVDTNSNGEIEFSEALNISYLDVNQSNIADMTGLEAFTNLTYLDCRLNLVLSNLNVSSLTNLTYLNAYYAGLFTITLTPSIVNLDISANNLTGNLDLTSFTNLQTFKSGPYNGLTSLNLSGLTNLTTVDCSNNSLTSLNVDGCTQLQSLNCVSNQIATFNGSGLVSLLNFDCTLNQILSLDVSTSANLQTLSCGSNLLSTLNLGTNYYLSYLDCNNNNLSSLNVDNCPNLQTLYLYTNPISSINLLNNIILQNLYASSTNLTSIDLSNNSFLNYIDVSSNPQLTYLSLKNGGIEEGISIFSNPNLQFVCADDNEIESIQQQLNIALLENVTVNSYCSFTPGGDFNTLTGTATFDVNNNGCDASDIPFDLLSLNVSLNGISTNSSVITNNSGVYSLYTNVVGEYQLTPNFENPTFYNVSPVVQLFPVIDNSTATQNFCITANGAHPDLEIIIAPITPARPGFDALYQIVYKNKGNQTLSGSYTFNYDDVKLDYISATVIPNTFATGILTWNYTNLMPFENRTVYVTLNVNSPVEIPAVNIGDIFTFSSTINPITGDETPSDNTFTYAQTVVGSYDPNDITCTEGQTVAPSEIGEYLHYIVNFENTGNYYAENVVVKIEIDATKYDVSSLQLLNTSSESKSKITNNVVEFIFEGINLAAASGNPPVGGHGNVLFKIKSKNNLVTGDMVQKAAKIYFDYNAPIETNLSQTTYQSLNNPIFEFDESVKVYPNPTQSIININSNFNIQSIELYDVQGRILEKSFEDNTATTLDISERQNGIYFVKINSDKGSKIEKVIKN